MAEEDVAVAESEVADDDTFIANGIHVGDGKYLVQPLPPAVMSDIALGRPLDEKTVLALAAIRRRTQKRLGIVPGIDSNMLGSAGWGIAFLADDPEADAICEALKPLLDWRREQCGDLYREYKAAAGIPADSDGWTFLAALGSSTGQPVDPKIVSYYLTIVASPQQVSFDAQCAMDTQNAVGRIWFDGATRQQRLDALERYAKSMVTREKSSQSAPQRALFFAARNKGDKATQRSAKLLAEPVSKHFAGKYPGWQVDPVIGPPAIKKTLADALNGNEPPSLLFTATHGAAFDAADVRQLEQQGALVCQDWEGLASVGPLTEAEYFAAPDITTAKLPGTIAFLFACYGAGTPQHDAFLPQEVVDDVQIAPQPFVARLPQQLLLSGAGAVIGHVERAWTCSFQWKDAGAQTQVFRSVLQLLAEGKRVGAVMEYFDQRCSAISKQLVDAERAHKFGKKNELDIGGLWTAQMDARNYIVLGDPAARLSV